MNKKLSLLLISSIISAALIVDGDSVNARVPSRSADGAIIETYGMPYEFRMNKIDSSSLPKLDKYYLKFVTCICNYDFNDSENYFANYLTELFNVQQYNKSAFQKSYNKALNDLTEVSEAYPMNAYPKYFLAKLYQMVDDYDTAIKLMKECAYLDKMNPLYRYELGNLYFDTNNNEKATRIFEQLKKQFPREKEYRVALAKAYTNAALYSDAVREYRVAAAFEPEDDDTVAALVTASNYSKMVKSRAFYDPMTAVTATPTSTSGHKQEVVAFGTNSTQSFSASQHYSTNLKDAKGEYIMAKSTPTLKTADKTKETVQSEETNTKIQPNNIVLKEKNQRTKSTRSATSDKRVMVTYINGRKVVKIVNISRDTDVNNTLVNSTNSLSKQITDTTTQKNNAVTSDYSLAPSNTNEKINNNSDIFSTEESSYSTAKYNYNDKDYYSQKQDNSVSDVQEQHKILVTNKNGKKATDASAALNTQTQEKKKFWKKDKKTDASQETPSSADNTEIYLKANELLAQNQYHQVIDLLSKVNPPTLRSITSIASCYNALGNTDAAIVYYDKADKLSPGNSQVLFSLAYLYFSKNEIEKAKFYLTQSLQANPNNSNALQLKTFMSQQDSNDDMNKAVSSMNSGNYSDAKKILDKLVQKDSSNFQVFYYLGHICYATQKYTEAVQDFQKAVKLNPEYALSYYSLGLAYDKLKKFNDSLASYERFLQMSTDDNKYTQYAKTRISTINSKK